MRRRTGESRIGEDTMKQIEEMSVGFTNDHFTMQ
jgi:hypothetical protein